MRGHNWGTDFSVYCLLTGPVNPSFLSVSPGWMQTMTITFIDGRDFRAEDAFPDVAMVNETFARQYFNGQNPVGRSFDRMEKKKLVPTRIVGYVRDAGYTSMRDPIRPTIYVPFQSIGDKGGL